METTKTTVEKYSKELEEISNLLEQLKNGEVWTFEVMNKIKILIINVYAAGKSDGIEVGREIFSH